MNSDSAIGVTYSWLKRTSVRTKSASPGWTAGMPSAPVAASAIARFAMIFSQSVIGRAEVAVTGGTTSPARRALLNANSPPCSTISVAIGSSPFVNSPIGIDSPFCTRSISPKSVDVSSPMFWQFWP